MWSGRAHPMQSALSEQPKDRTITEPQIAVDKAAPRRRMASPETRRHDALDWAAFEAWCKGQGRGVLPAASATVAAFLAAGAKGLRAAAIAAKHRHSGLTSPLTDPAV